MGTVDRRLGVTLRWRPPSREGVVLIGLTSVDPSAAAWGGCYCAAAGASGTFTIPPVILASLPASQPAPAVPAPSLWLTYLPSGPCTPADWTTAWRSVYSRKRWKCSSAEWTSLPEREENGGLVSQRRAGEAPALKHSRKCRAAWPHVPFSERPANLELECRAKTRGGAARRAGFQPQETRTPVGAKPTGASVPEELS
jgi:hypothetical protein